MSKENPILLLMLCEKRFSQERKKSQSKMVLLKLSILYFNKPVFLNFADQLATALVIPSTIYRTKGSTKGIISQNPPWAGTSSTFKNIFGRNKVAYTLILFLNLQHCFIILDSGQK